MATDTEDRVTPDMLAAKKRGRPITNPLNKKEQAVKSVAKSKQQKKAAGLVCREYWVNPKTANALAKLKAAGGFSDMGAALDSMALIIEHQAATLAVKD